MQSSGKLSHKSSAVCQISMAEPAAFPVALWVRCLLDRVHRRRPTALTTAGACWGRPFPSGCACVPGLGIAGAAAPLRRGLCRDRLRHFDVADRGAGGAGRLCVVPAPADDAEVREVCLPHLVNARGGMLEAIRCTHQHIRRARDEVRRLQDPVYARFGHEVALPVSSSRGERSVRASAMSTSTSSCTVLGILFQRGWGAGFLSCKPSNPNSSYL
jgi:hypothetical protein